MFVEYIASINLHLQIEYWDIWEPWPSIRPDKTVANDGVYKSDSHLHNIPLTDYTIPHSQSPT